MRALAQILEALKNVGVDAQTVGHWNCLTNEEKRKLTPKVQELNKLTSDVEPPDKSTLTRIKKGETSLNSPQKRDLARIFWLLGVVRNAEEAKIPLDESAMANLIAWVKSRVVLKASDVVLKETDEHTPPLDNKIQGFAQDWEPKISSFLASEPEPKPKPKPMPMPMPMPMPEPETPSAPQALASGPATQTTQNLSVREQLAIIFTQHPALRDYLADELRAKLPACQVNDIPRTVEALVDFIYDAEVGQRLLDLATYQRKALDAGKITAAQELHWLVRWFLPWVETLPLAQADGPIIELPPTTWAMVERAVAQADRREMRVCLGQASDGRWVIGQTALLTADISPTQPDAWIKGIEEQLGGVLPLMGRNPMSLADALEVAEASQQAAQTAQFLPADALVPFYVIIARERPQDRSGEQYWLGQYRGLRLVYLPQRSYGEPQSDTRKVTLKIEEALGTLLRGSQPRSLR